MKAMYITQILCDYSCSSYCKLINIYLCMYEQLHVCGKISFQTNREQT